MPEMYPCTGCGEWVDRRAEHRCAEKVDGAPIQTAIHNLLDALEIEQDESFTEHMLVLCEAMRIYADRRARYGDGWKLYGWMDSLFHMRNKMLRTETEFWKLPPDDHAEALARLDNPYDLLNYTTFFIRNVIRNNERGDI